MPAAAKRSVELLAAVGIPAPEQRLAQYPHQLSGGMRQRVAIAIALSCEPKLLIADEPTTALDVTIQAQILDLLAREQRRRHMAMILITHDLGVVAGRTDEVAVMYAGRVVERAPTPALVQEDADALHRGAAGGAAASSMPRRIRRCRRSRAGRPIRPGRCKGCSFSPRCRYAVGRCHAEKPALDGSGVPRAPVSPASIRSKSMRGPAHDAASHAGRFERPAARRSTTSSSNIPVGGKIVHAVSGVSLQIARGETLGLVGESGCGKSTLGRAVLQLRRPTSGRVLFDGQDLTTMQGDALRLMRRRVQLIFQDPIASLNPRRRIGDIVAEPLVIAGVKDPEKRKQLVDEVLSAVGLDPALVVGRLPHEFSGGQCQRICIARALILNPEFIVCDEPVSALDVSIRAQILNLLEEMKARFGLTLLFIAHDLAVVKAVSDRVAVMYLGRLCEVGPSEQLFARPAHPYTALLIEAIPVPDPDVRPTETVPVGRAAIADRAAVGLPVPHPLPARGRSGAATEVPELRAVAPGQFAACHHPLI